VKGRATLLTGSSESGHRYGQFYVCICNIFLLFFGSMQNVIFSDIYSVSSSVTSKFGRFFYQFYTNTLFFSNINTGFDIL
jgi:hypothetical protein